MIKIEAIGGKIERCRHVLQSDDTVPWLSEHSRRAELVHKLANFVFYSLIVVRVLQHKKELDLWVLSIP